MAFFPAGQSALTLAGRLLESAVPAQCGAAFSALAVSASTASAATKSNGKMQSILPPRKPVKPRKRPSQLVRPAPQAPLVAEHVISRQVFASPPGRMAVGTVLGEDAAKALAARMGGAGAGPAPGAAMAAEAKGAASKGSGSGSDSESAIDVARTGPSQSAGSGSSSSSGGSSGVARGGAGRTAHDKGSSSSESSSVGTVRFTSDSTGSAAAASSSEGVPSPSEGEAGVGSALIARPGGQAGGGEGGEQHGRTGRRRKVKLADLPEGQRKQLSARRAALKSLALAFPPGVTDATVFAVVNHAGRQYKVTEGDIIQGEKVKHAPVGATLTLPVAMLGSRSKTVLGRPLVPGAHVLVTVEEHARDAKDVVFKKKRRKRYQRTQGHRREVTRLRVTAISGDMATF